MTEPIPEPIPVDVPVDRPLEEMEEMIARLNTELADFRTTVLARLSTRPTGTIEPTILSTAPAGTLLMQGQTVNRATYPVLWAWAQANGRVVTGLFGVGNGTTTFTLPDFRGRFLIASGTLGANTYVPGSLGGDDAINLTTSQLAAHSHTFSFGSAGTHNHGGTGSTGSHSHGGSVSTDGSHGGHSSGTTNVTQSGSGVTLPASYSASGGSHSHSITTDSAGSHSHSISDSGSHTHSFDIDDTGTGAAIDIRPPYIGGNWLIYT